MRRRPCADASAAEPEAAATQAFEEVRRRLGADAPLRTLLTAVLDKAVEAIRADRGLLILLDPAKSKAELNPSAEGEVIIARNLEGETIRDAADYCRSILREVAAGDAILAMDVPADGRFRARQSVTLYNILSLMCVPLKVGDRVLGAIYFDSRSGDRLFRQDDLRLIEAYSVNVSGAIAEAQESQRLREQAVVVNRELARQYQMDNLIGESSAMQRLFRMMEAVIRADCNVLIVGESGTGKELVARAIHYAGSRKLCNFVPLDCGAVPENLIESELFGHRRGAFTGADSDKKGLFEEADGGSLFLDEITNTSPAFQAKLLRALQSGEVRRVGETLTRRVDARIIAASNADIDEAIKNGTFREDLYYRLNVVTLKLPTLRERPDDIPLLAEHFARQFCQSRGIAYRGIGRGAMARLQAHSWPGNVRELEHAIEAALVVSGDGMVRRETLPEKILGGEIEVVRDLLCEAAAAESSRNTQPGDDDLDSAAEPPDGGEPEERARVERALIECGGDKSRAARQLGWNRMKLYRRLKILGIPYDTGKEAG
jgi:Nif-specific regulatory protein